MDTKRVQVLVTSGVGAVIGVTSGSVSHIVGKVVPHGEYIVKHRVIESAKSDYQFSLLELNKRLAGEQFLNLVNTKPAREVSTARKG